MTQLGLEQTMNPEIYNLLTTLSPSFQQNQKLKTQALAVSQNDDGALAISDSTHIAVNAWAGTTMFPAQCTRALSESLRSLLNHSVMSTWFLGFQGCCEKWSKQLKSWAL